MQEDVTKVLYTKVIKMLMHIIEKDFLKRDMLTTSNLPNVHLKNALNLRMV